MSLAFLSNSNKTVSCCLKMTTKSLKAISKGSIKRAKQTCSNKWNKGRSDRDLCKE